jgi:hypothetical protein
MTDSNHSDADTIPFAVPAALGDEQIAAAGDAFADAAFAHSLHPLTGAGSAIVDVTLGTIEKAFGGLGRMLLAAERQVSGNWELSEVTFGLTLTGKGSFVVASAEADASIRVTFKPKRAIAGQTPS